MAMSLKLTQDAREVMSIQGKVMHHEEHQRELQYFIESVDIIGSLLMPSNWGHHSEDSSNSNDAFPGFVWSVLMTR